MPPKQRLCRLAWTLLLAAPSAISAQWKQLPLPDLHGATVNAIAIDHQGALWLGTNKGLRLFDGVDLVEYRHVPGDTRSILNDRIDALHEDPEGTLWVGTTAGVCIKRKEATSFEPRPFLSEDGKAVQMEARAIAPGRDGGVWAFCGNAFVYRCAPGDSLFRPVNTSQEDPADRYSSGYESTDGGLWYVARTRLLHMDPRTGTRKVFPYRPKGHDAHPKTLFLHVLPDARDPHVKWITTWGMGLLAFDDRTGTFTNYLDGRSGEPDLVNIVLDALPGASDGWPVVLEDRLMLFDPRKGNGAVAIYSPRHAVVEGIRVLWRAADGRTYAGGTGEVWVHTPMAEGAQALAGTLAWPNVAIAPSRNGGFWAVRFYTNRELLRTDQWGNAVDSIPLPVRQQPYECFHLVEDLSGTVWIASTRGLLRFDLSARKFEHVPLPLPEDPHPHVMDLLVLPNGDLGMALGSLGFALRSATDGSFRLLKPGLAGKLIDINAISALDGHQILLTSRNGIVNMDLTDLTYRPLIPDNARTPALSGISGCAVLGDGSIMAWSQELGPMRLVRTPAGGTAVGADYRLDSLFKMPGDPSFTAGCTDRQGVFWLTSDQSLWRYSASDGAFQRMDEFNGAPFGSADAVMPDASSDGRVLVRSGIGWWRFGSGFAPRREPHVPLIRGVLVNGTPINIDGGRSDGLMIKYGRDAITVQYGAVDLFRGSELRYAYRLTVDGDTGAWVDQGFQRAVTFADQSPGVYQLAVRVLNRPADGPAAVAAWTIAPPWWGTWWARTGMLLLVALITVAITRTLISMRYRRHIAALERERGIERERERIARDIHDGIGSGLTRINMISRRLEGADPNEVARIVRTTAELVQELSGIVWTVDPGNDALSTFLAYVRNTVGKQFDGLNVVLATDYRIAPGDGEWTMGPEIKRHLLLLINEAVNNALKHSGADHITVRLHLSRKEVELMVKDNGHGFDVGNAALGGNGLANFRKRAESLNGAAVITSDTNGTTVSVRLSIPSTKM